MTSNGTVWAWGYNWYGQLGDGTTTNRSTPVQVRFVQKNTLSVSVKAGDYVSVPVAVSNAADLSSVEFWLEYNPLDFDLYDACEATSALETSAVYIPSQYLTITSVGAGQVKFQSTRSVYGTWTGLINTVKLKAKRTCTATIDVYSG